MFNEIFKKFADQIDEKLKDHYKEEDKATESKENLQNLGECDLTRDMSAIFSEMPLSDIELEVEGKILEAHKIILWGNYARVCTGKF